MSEKTNDDELIDYYIGQEINPIPEGVRSGAGALIEVVRSETFVGAEEKHKQELAKLKEEIKWLTETLHDEDCRKREADYRGVVEAAERVVSEEIDRYGERLLCGSVQALDTSLKDQSGTNVERSEAEEAGE